ncbi:MAG TPA: hypothetical protein PLV37_07750, partial [Bacillota bacterium]|nr:hypothetical protein [Bacillota bacterium]
GDIEYEAPHYYCNLHNPDPHSYPINPNLSIQPYIPRGNEQNNGSPPWTDQPSTENPATDDHPDTVVSPNDSDKPEWLN